MQQKLLWKIEELWSQYFKNSKEFEIDIGQNYHKGVSKYYKKFHLVNHFDFTESKEIVFTDDFGNYKGLKKLQVSASSGKPVYLFDNHNEMIYPIVEIAEVSGKKYDVVHIDAHPDDAIFKSEKPKKLPLGEVGEFIRKTRISDFFDALSIAHVIPAYHVIPAKAGIQNIISNTLDSRLRGNDKLERGNNKEKPLQKLIGTIFRVCHSDSFEFFLPPEKPYILSLDIDIFGPEGDFAELKDKVRAVALAWSGAEAVCIATSPGFIDQDHAWEIIKIITHTK